MSLMMKIDDREKENRCASIKLSIDHSGCRLGSIDKTAYIIGMIGKNSIKFFSRFFDLVVDWI